MIGTALLVIIVAALILGPPIAGGYLRKHWLFDAKPLRRRLAADARRIFASKSKGK